MKRFLEHGHNRMIEVLKHPNVLGNVMPAKFWKMLEAMDRNEVKDYFYENVSNEKIKELEKLKFKLDNWKG